MLLHSKTIFIPKSYHSFIISNYINININPLQNIPCKKILYIKPGMYPFLNYKNCIHLITNSYQHDIPLHIYNDFSSLLFNKYNLTSNNTNKPIYFSFQHNKLIYWNIILDPIQYQLGY
jgi:hypothetical protein